MFSLFKFKKKKQAAPTVTLLPDSQGEHFLQTQFDTQQRAFKFYDRQVLNFLSPIMMDFVPKQEVLFIATSDSHGECVEHRGEVFGLVAPVYRQARVCAEQLAGDSDAVFQPQLTATVLDDPGLGVYRKIVIENDIVVGTILYGDTRDSAWYLVLIEHRTNIAGIRDNLMFNRLALAG